MSTLPFGSSKMIKHFGTDSFQTKELVLNIQSNVFFCRKPNKKRKRSTLFVAGQIACYFSLYWAQIHQLRFIHVLLYLSRKKGIRAIYLKEALFNIATKTTIFAEKNVITCNIAVTNMKVSIMTRHCEWKSVFSKGILFLLQIRVFLSPVGLFHTILSLCFA